MPYLASALLYKSLTKIGFTIAAFYVGGYLAALGAYSSTLDYSLAHSASGEGPSASSVRVAISVVRSSSKAASSEVVAGNLVTTIQVPSQFTITG